MGEERSLQMSAPRLSEDWKAGLRALKEGWDSYGSKPISEAALAAVGDIFVVPLVNGGIQLEIHKEGLDAEIEISPEGRFKSVYISR